MNVPSPQRAQPALSLWLLVLSVLCVNPAITVIVGLRPLLAALICLGIVVMMQGLWRRFGRGLTTVYAVNFLVIAGVWLHIEAVIRTRYHEYVVEDLYEQHGSYYTNRRRLNTRLTDKEYSVDYITNRDGYRIGPTQDVERSVEHVDWLFLGDSYTQGAQVEFDSLYTTRLYRRYPDRIVLNSGLSGWGLYESLAFLQARGPALQPRVVFIQISNFNDFMNVQPRQAGLSDYLMQESEAVRLLLQNIKYANPTSLPLGRWVEPFSATDEENRRSNVFYRRSSREKEEDLQSVSTVIRALDSECRRLGAQLVLVQVPTKEQISFRFLDEAITGLHINPRLLDMDFPNRFVRRLADSLSLVLIDPLQEWRTAAAFPFFQYDEHLNDGGHDMLANAIASALARAGITSFTRILSTSYQGDRYPQFTPSGDSIVFHSWRYGGFELLKADIRTWREHRITVDDSSETHPVLLPRNEGLVFVVGDAATGATRLWRSVSNGSRPVRLLSDLTQFAAIPAVFPDGRSIVFPAWGPTPDARNTYLTTLSLVDGHQQRLPQAVTQVWRPAVDPSGRYVAYIGDVSGAYDLFELDMVTRTTRRLTSTPFDEWDPTYTREGDAIIYAARTEDNWDLWRLPRSGGAQTRITRTKGDEWDPQVSPDGRWIAYGGEYGLMRGIYLMPLRK